MASGNRGQSGASDLGLVILRAGLGTVFFAHGAMKVFVMGPGGVTGFFTSLGAPLPAITAPLVIAAEFLGGAALILGLFTRFTAVSLAGDMLGAILLAKAGTGFFAPRGFELELTLGISSLALAFTGAGRYSLDAVIRRRRKE
jgi:putative oxidoreductase